MATTDGLVSDTKAWGANEFRWQRALENRGARKRDRHRTLPAHSTTRPVPHTKRKRHNLGRWMHKGEPAQWQCPPSSNNHENGGDPGVQVSIPAPNTLLIGTVAVHAEHLWTSTLAGRRNPTPHGLGRQTATLRPKTLTPNRVAERIAALQLAPSIPQLPPARPVATQTQGKEKG